MLKHKSFKQFITAMMILTVITFIGCEKKTEQQQNDVNNERNVPDTISSVSEPVVNEEIAIPDLIGTWTGTFDKRTTTLKITQQTDSSFSGKIEIKYREIINQEVKGIFSPSTLKFSMEDQIHSKYMGKYNGKISDDFKNLSGTFTKNRDGAKTSFNLNKK